MNKEIIESVKVGNDPDITSDCITTTVFLPENGISSCIITANNDIGKNYLAHFKLLDEVTVKYAYEEDNPVWDNIEPVFRGKIIELQPSLSRSGEIVSVTAINIGFCLKQMRVANEYGTQAIHPNINPEKDVWTESLTPADGVWSAAAGDVSLDTTFRKAGSASIKVHSVSMNWVGAIFTLNTGKEVNSNLYPFLNFFLYLEETYNGNVTVFLYDTADKYARKNIIVSLGGWNGIDLKAGSANASEWTEVESGFDWSNIKKVRIDGWFSGTGSGDFWIDVLYFDEYPLITETLREVLCNTNNGLIRRYVEKILNTNADSGYSLNTDYVYNDLSKYTYLNFPYQDSFMCIQDLIRLGSSLHYVVNSNNWKGLHWIITQDGKLLIAPVGNHHVEGIPNKWVDSIWATRAPNEPLIVREDMITQEFKTEVPLANYVLVAGKYIYPLNDMWTESLDGWAEEHGHLGGVVSPTITFELNHKVYVKETSSLEYKFQMATGVRVYAVLIQSMNSDFVKLITKDSPVTIGLQIKGAMKGEELKLRLYCNDTKPTLIYDGETYRVRGNYFEVDLSKYLPGGSTNWNQIEIPVTKEDLFNTEAAGIWTSIVDGDYPQPTWDNIKWFIIWFKTGQAGAAGATDVWNIDDINIVGNCIRGAYTSDCGKSSIDECTIGCIKHYGCKFLTIKDSLASTDTLDSVDDSSPIAQLALYELLRNRIPRTSGQITIPLNPDIKPGQLIHIHACYDEANKLYKIDRDFRITQVQHNFVVQGAVSLIKVVDDLFNSIPIDTMEPYTVIMRAVNPDYQTKTFASLKTGGDFITNQKPISKEYNQ